MVRTGTTRPRRDLVLASSSREFLTYSLLCVADMTIQAVPDDTVDALEPAAARASVSWSATVLGISVFSKGCVTTEMGVLGRAVR